MRDRRNPWRDGPPALPSRRPRKTDRTARYYKLLPPEPTTLTVDAARDFWLAADTILNLPLVELAQRGLYAPWDKHERANLKRIVDRWARRAQGLDIRWLQVGSRAGGWHGSGRSKEIALIQRPAADPAWEDD